MGLASGARLGSYEILAAVGEGGMGAVYRARDTKLQRDVAIKVLLPALATDPDRLARFSREAQLLAALNHPHIAQIYGLEEANGVQALVMELVEGPTLADRIAKGAIPLDEALSIAKQIAEALEAAHNQGVIHRDLKPANIKLRLDGAVKVLDFGLAKALEPVGALPPGVSQSPTITTPAMTQAGLILGTATYMSPEQARGKVVDRRADLWAFGTVLYEMLTGARAFQGEDVGDTLAAVVKSDVNWGRLPDATPPGIRTLLRRCLRKDPRQRLGDAGAARIEIEEALAEPQSDPASRVTLWQRGVSLPVVLLLGIAAVAAAWTLAALRQKSPTPQERSSVARLTLPLPRGTELSGGSTVAISPDGGQVAYVASRGNVPQLYLRPMNGSEARPVARTEGATAPFFSPDGQSVGFFADGKLKKVSTTGGVVVTVADASAATRAGWGTWGPHDTIVFDSGTGGLVEVSSAGGTPRSLMTPEQMRGMFLRNPAFLPDGHAVLATTSPRGAETADQSSIEIVVVKTGEHKVLVQGGSAARYLPTGHVVFQRSGTVMAAPLDLERLELTGAPVEVIEGVRQPFSGVGAFDCSRVGTCIYVAGSPLTQRTVALVDRTGASQLLPLPAKSYGHPRFSPKGDKISFWIQQLRCDIEVYDIARGTTTRLTSDSDNHFPVWTPDGQQITYVSRKSTPPSSGSELFSKPANGAGSEERLSQTPQVLSAITPISWSADGGVLAFASRGDIWLLPRGGGQEARPFLQSRFNETTPAFSRDGRWLAYGSDESGRFEIYVRPFPGPGETFLISMDGGTGPVWARNGRELFFRNGDRMMAVDVSTHAAFTASRPRLLFTGTFVRDEQATVNYDVSPDGEHFLMLNSGEQERAATEISVLLNWFDELNRLVPRK